MYAFYFSGINDLQDMGSTLLRSLEKGKNCWVCFFDCLDSKRQLFYYEASELKKFIEDLCIRNDLPVPIVDFYGQKDKKSFEQSYKSKSPGVVFMQNAVHKYPLWQPTAEDSKVVHFAWGLDSKHNLHRSTYNIDLNVLRHEDEITEYEKCGFLKSKYFGNMRLDQFSWTPYFSTLNLEQESRDVCFVPEVWFTKNKETHSGRPLEKIISMMDKAIDLLHKEGYCIVWKRREKGLGARVINPVPMLKIKPDYVIEKDLNFPSSLYHLAKISEACLFYSPSGAKRDLDLIAEKSILLEPEADTDKELARLMTFIKKDKTTFSLPKISPSSKLLQYIEDYVEI